MGKPRQKRRGAGRSSPERERPIRVDMTVAGEWRPGERRPDLVGERAARSGEPNLGELRRGSPRGKPSGDIEVEGDGKSRPSTGEPRRVVSGDMEVAGRLGASAVSRQRGRAEQEAVSDFDGEASESARGDARDGAHR